MPRPMTTTSNCRALKVILVHIRDLQLTTRRRSQRLCDFNDLVVVKVEARHRIARFGNFRLLFQTQSRAGGIEFNHSVALRIVNRVSKDPGSGLRLAGLQQSLRKIVSIKNVVTQDQRATGRTDEVAADQKRLGNSLRPRLNRILKTDTETCRRHPAAARIGEYLAEWK